MFKLLCYGEFFVGIIGLSNVEIKITNQEYEEFMLHVVRNKPDNNEIKQWLENHASEE